MKPSPIRQVPLVPEPDPDCTRNLAIWAEDGIRKQLCCCEECDGRRESALRIQRYERERVRA